MLMSIEMIDTENNKIQQNIYTLLTKYAKLIVFSLDILRRGLLMSSCWIPVLGEDVVRITRSESIVLRDDVVDICKLPRNFVKHYSYTMVVQMESIRAHVDMRFDDTIITDRVIGYIQISQSIRNPKVHYSSIFLVPF